MDSDFRIEETKRNALGGIEIGENRGVGDSTCGYSTLPFFPTKPTKHPGSTPLERDQSMSPLARMASGACYVFLDRRSFPLRPSLFGFLLVAGSGRTWSAARFNVLPSLSVFFPAILKTIYVLGDPSCDSGRCVLFALVRFFSLLEVSPLPP